MDTLQKIFNAPSRLLKLKITPCTVGFLALFLSSCGGDDSSSSGGGVTPLKDISATAGSYGEAIFMGEDTPSPLTGLNPTDANASYISDDENICTVDSKTGTVTGVKEGECRITLTLSKTGYNDKIIDYVVSVTFLPVNVFKGKHIFKGLLIGPKTKPVFTDVDGDGDLDLVVGVEDGTLKYYRRNAADEPILFTEITGTDNPFDGFDMGSFAAPTFADIDGDGDLDLVSGETLGTLKLYLNESTTNSITFTPKTGNTDNPFDSVDVGFHSVPIFADISGDGDLDLVVGENGGTLKYFLNESTEDTITFTEKTGSTDNPFHGFLVGNRAAPTFYDIDGDNKIDLLVGDNDGVLSYYLNESTDSAIVFTKKTDTNNPFNSFDVGSFAAPTFADIEGDGDFALVMGSTDGTLKLFLNKQTGNTTSWTQQTETGNPFGGIDIGDASKPKLVDIDGDNDLDLVTGETRGMLNYFLNESTTNSITFTPKTTSTNNPFHGFDIGAYSTPKFADVDGDNDLDLVVGEYDGNFNFYLNESANGTITFTTKTGSGNNPFHGFDTGSYSVPTFADIDGDNDLDLVAGEYDGFLIYYLNESTTSTISFTKKTSTDNPFNGLDVGNFSAPIFVDIDGDNDLDVVSGNGEGYIITIIDYYGTWVPFL